MLAVRRWALLAVVPLLTLSGVAPGHAAAGAGLRSAVIVPQQPSLGGLVRLDLLVEHLRVFPPLLRRFGAIVRAWADARGTDPA